MPCENPSDHDSTTAARPVEAPAGGELSRVDDYGQALELLYDRIDYEKIGHAPYTANHYRLDRMRQLLNLLGSPQEAYSIVHLAGTKGKGTTAILTSNALQECGRRVGLVTSPHLLRLEERIQFQGQPCTERQMVALTESVLGASGKLEAHGCGRATFFELTTAMGMLHAAEQGADCVVLEVGLGGRLDSTNICQPVVSVITSISLDHQAQLGNTIAAIAAEKAGIIKPKTTVVCTARSAEARQVIQRTADQQQAPLRLIDRDFSVQWRPRSLEPGSAGDAVADVIYRSGLAPPDQSARQWQLTTRMLGRHQADNMGGALAVLEVLREQGWDLPVERAHAALAGSLPAGRLELVGRAPLKIIDTAHNPASIAAALRAVDEHFRGKPRVLVFASSRDKEYRQMLEYLVPGCEHLVLTAYRENPRALPSTELFAAAESVFRQSSPELAARQASDRPRCMLHHAATPEEAWRLSAALAPSDGLILATGSFFLAAELLPLKL